jgi:hypothetical protein
LVLLSQSTNTVAEAVTIGTDNTAAIQAEVDALELDLAAHVQNVTDAHDIDTLRTDLAAHVANVTDAHDIDDKLVWAGRWAAGSYKRNDLVNDSGWLAVANVDTSQRPIENQDWMLPTVPSWVASSVPGPIVLGVRLPFTATTVIKRLRAWLNVGSTLSLVVDPLGTPVRQDWPLTGTGWIDVDLPDIALPSGAQVDLFLTVPGASAPQDVIPNGWPVAAGFRQIGVYNPATVVLVRDQYGVDMLAAYFGLDWDLVSWPS